MKEVWGEELIKSKMDGQAGDQEAILKMFALICLLALSPVKHMLRAVFSICTFIRFCNMCDVYTHESKYIPLYILKNCLLSRKSHLK